MNFVCQQCKQPLQVCVRSSHWLHASVNIFSSTTRWSTSRLLRMTWWPRHPPIRRTAAMALIPRSLLSYPHRLPSRQPGSKQHRVVRPPPPLHHPAPRSDSLHARHHIPMSPLCYCKTASSAIFPRPFPRPHQHLRRDCPIHGLGPPSRLKHLP